MPYSCPHCNQTSYDPDDERQAFCSNCGKFQEFSASYHPKLIETPSQEEPPSVRLARLVRKMRAHQKRYFQGRSPDDLALSKEAERQVDEAVEWIFGKREAQLGFPNMIGPGSTIPPSRRRSS